jgi:hypothetical protein
MAGRKSTGEKGREDVEKENKGSMTVSEAGHRGGEKTAETHGHEFYEEIGHKGGQRVRELIEEGKKVEGEEGTSSRGAGRGRSSEESSRR